VVVLRWRFVRELAFGFVYLPFSASLYFSRQKSSRADAIVHAIGGVFYNAFTGKKKMPDSDSTCLLLSTFTACLHRTDFSIILSHKS
jgi:hypothetical protein